MRVKPGLLIILAVLVVAFVVAEFGVDRKPGDKPLIPNFAPGRAAKIILDGKERQTVLERFGEQWIVTSEDSLATDPVNIETIMERIAGFSSKDMISSNPEKHAIYEVDSSGVGVTMEDQEGRAMVTLVVGKVGSDFQSTYVRDTASDKVILASGYLAPVFDRGDRTWQDRRIYDFEPSEILKIHITHQGETFTLARDRAQQWYIAQPESAAVKSNRMTRVVRTLAYLRCEEFAGKAAVPEFGLDEPDSLIRFRTPAGEETLSFGNHNEDKRVYVRRAGNEVVYEIASYKADAMLPRLGQIEEQATGDE